MENDNIVENDNPETQRQAVSPDNINLHNNNDANLSSSPFRSVRQQVIKQEINTIFEQLKKLFY